MFNQFEVSEKTQAETIKAHLEAGNTITTFEAFQLWGYVCLPQRIRDLRMKGYVIESKSVINNGKRFNVYWWGEQDNAPTASAPATRQGEE